LSHIDHLKAHFLLWKYWNSWQNATPLMMMCKNKKTKIDFKNESLLEEYLPIYESACIAHALQVSKTHTGKIVKE